MYMYVPIEKCTSTRAHGVGGLPANTVHCILKARGGRLSIDVQSSKFIWPDQQGISTRHKKRGKNKIK